jgi:benzodiazapine receptor
VRPESKEYLMSELASPGQLRAAFIRWALVLVPGALVLGLLSGRVAGGGPGNPWFEALVKPDIYPPSALFGIVWTVLYVLMGLALAMIVTARGAPYRGLAIGLFLVQFGLNLAWSPLFFGAHRITGALMLLGALDLVVLVTFVLFWRIRTLAGVLLLPYLGWALFATLLTWQFLELNPGADGAAGAGAVTSVEF